MTLFDPEPKVQLEPVRLEVVRLCHFKAKPCRICGKPMANRIHEEPKGTPECPGQRQNGCATCSRNKGDVAHYGAPKSYNAIGSGRGTGAAAMVGANLKQAWQAIFVERLQASSLPTGLERVFAEGEITFPDQREDRDQGNFRVVIEKALGDALQQGGYLERDSWDHYEFGNLTRAYLPGESATRVILFPWAKEGDA